MDESGYDPHKAARIIAQNDRRGRKAFEGNNLQLLNGRPDAWDENFFTLVTFTAESAQKVQSVVDKIQREGERLGISFYLAGRDSPIHSTLQAGFYKSDSDSERNDIYKNIYDDPRINRIAPKLLGLVIEYKYLSINRDSITLNAVQIPSEIRNFREGVMQSSRENGAESISMDNYLHITLARITHLPEKNGAEALRELKGFLIKLRHHLSKQPIQLEIAGVASGPADKQEGQLAVKSTK